MKTKNKYIIMLAVLLFLLVAGIMPPAMAQPHSPRSHMTMICGQNGTMITGSSTITLPKEVKAIKRGPGSEPAEIHTKTNAKPEDTTKFYTPDMPDKKPALKLGGEICGDGGFIKDGQGGMVIPAKNCYNGPTIIKGGGVKIDKPNGSEEGSPLGTTSGRTIIMEGAFLDLNGVDILSEEPLTLNGSGISGEGALINDSPDAAEFKGIITLESDARIKAEAGDINITHPGEITGNHGLTLDGAKNIEIKSVIATAAAPVKKDGAGTLSLSGKNTYTGLTEIHSGKVKLEAIGDGFSGPLGSPSGETVISDGAVLDLNGFSLVAEEDLKLSGDGISGEGALINNSAVPAEFKGSIVLEANAKIAAKAGAIKIKGNGDITGAYKLELECVKKIDIECPIKTTAAAVEKKGYDTLTLSGYNTYTGDTKIYEGRVKLGATGNENAGPLGAPSGKTVISDGAALDLNGFSLAAEEPLELSGSGIAGEGALINKSAAAAEFKGAIALKADAKIAAKKGDIKFKGDREITGAYKLELECEKKIEIEHAIKTIAAPVEKKGQELLTLSGQNTYTGITHIKQGTVRLKASAGREEDSPLGSPEGGTIVEDGAVLDLNGVSVLTEEPLTLSGDGIDNEGALVNKSPAAAEFKGLLKLEKATKIAAEEGDIYISNPGEIKGEFKLALKAKKEIKIKSVIDIGDGDVEKTGTGTLKLAAANKYSGKTKILQGKLKLEAVGVGDYGPLGTSEGETEVSEGAVLDLNGFSPVTAEPLTLNGYGPSNEGALTNSSPDDAEFKGLITLESNTMIATDEGAVNITNPGAITGEYALALAGDGNIEIVSDIATGVAPVEKYGDGTWTLSGDNTFTGPLSVYGGVVQLGADECLDNESLITLDGGTLSTGEISGFNENAGMLYVGPFGAVVSLGTGPHTLIFDASASLEWSPAATLDVAGWAGPMDGTYGYEGRLFFGNNEEGLTAAQLAHINFVTDGTLYPAKILPTGEIVTTGNWLGLESSDWFDGSNWYKGIIPDNSIDAIIPASAPNQPHIDVPGAVCRNIMINSGASLIIDDAANMSVHGNWRNNGTVNTLTSTVTFAGSTRQSIGGTASTTFYNLALDNPSGAVLGKNQTVTGTLTLTNGKLDLGNYNLTLDGSDVAGMPGPSNMIITTGTGQCLMLLTGDGSYTFPVGDAIGTADYSPITLDFTTGVYNNAWVGVSVKNEKHPNNASETHYLNRYWSVSSSGISAFSCNVTAAYVSDDIAGSEMSQVTGKFNGPLPWVKYTALAANTINADGVTNFSDFTGITLEPPSVSISADPGLLVCPGSVATLTAITIGDPPFSFLWAPGAETTQIITISTSVPGSSLFSVMITDGNGFSTSEEVMVTVNDTEAPSFICPADQSLQLDDLCRITIPSLVDGLTGSDNCGTVSFTQDPVAGTRIELAHNSSTTVIVTAHDGNGNNTSCNVILTGKDITPPAAICRNISAQLDASGTVTITPDQVDNGSYDVCSNFIMTLDITTFDCTDLGQNPVMLTVTDVAGNIATCNALVNIEDHVAPFAICQDITIQLSASGTGTIIPAQVNNGSSDACGIASFELDVSTFDCSNVGQNAVMLTVTDFTGNASTCSANVTVEDKSPPTAVCKDITVQLNASGIINITPDQINDGSSDVCGITSLSLDVATFDCTNIGQNTVMLTVMDIGGNVSTCNATVTVVDEISPVIALLGSPIVEHCQDEIYTDAGATAADNCSGDLTSSIITVNSVDTSIPGTYTVTYDVSDEYGNPASQVIRTVNVNLQLPSPVIIGPVIAAVNTQGLYSTPFTAGHTYAWTVTGGVIQGASNASVVSVLWGNDPGTGTINVTDINFLNGCSGLSETYYVTITETPTPIYRISGVVTYHHISNPELWMDNTSLTLVEGTNSIAATTTNALGYYEFLNVPDGTYKIEVTTNKPRGGLNATDAGLVNYWWTHRTPIERVKWNAGNFYAVDNFMNATDAGQIKGFFTTGTPQPAQEWFFWKQGALSSSNPPVSVNTFVVSGADLVQNYYALCVADFNRSFSPPPGLKSGAGASSIHLLYDEPLVAGPGTEVSLPIQVTSSLKAGAISMIIDFPSDYVTVEDVVLGNGDLSVSAPLQFSANGNELRIGWFDQVTFDLQASDCLVTLKLRTTENFSNGHTIRFSMQENYLNELADGMFEPIGNVVLLTRDIVSSITGIDPQEPALKMSLTCHPNPFYDVAWINYTLPCDDDVWLEITNMYGARVTVLVDAAQTRGDYTVKLDGISLNQGVYTVTLRTNTNALKPQTIKIVRGR
jgi:autotransporter-associated beta strand protein